MGSINPPLTHETSMWEIAERIFKLGAGAIAVTYTFGFLVVSTAHARYGIVLFDLFRARVLSAGILIVLFVSLPSVSALQLYGRNPSKLPQNAGWLGYSAFGISISWVCVIIAFSFYPLFPGNSRIVFHMSSNTAWWMLTCASLAALGFQSAQEKKIIKGILALCLIGVINFCAFVMLSREILILSVWFVALGVISVFLIRAIERHKTEGRGSVWYFTFVGYSIVIVVVFTHLLYFKIKPGWGGGLPQPVTVNITKPIPFSSPGNTRAFLVDETEKGYYLIHQASDHAASYVPREGIGSIDFEEVK
jgi:hypothetical protein